MTNKYNFTQLLTQFESFRKLYGNKMIDSEQCSELSEIENIEVVNNGSSGQKPNCDWFTASLLNSEGNYAGYSFNFYVSRY